jgi:hypothetical protein
MVTQRRYSVTGQTPPDDAEAMKARSPKLQALDTSGQTANCGLCDGGAESGANTDDGGGGQRRGRKMGPNGTIVRTSSKRSATQLPSPNSPSHQSPPKMARYRNDVDMDIDTETDSDSDLTDVAGYSSGLEHDHGFESQATSFPSTPEYSPYCNVSSLPDTARLDELQLYAEEGTDDEGTERYALSVPHSRKHSLDDFQLDEKASLREQYAWQALQDKQAEAIHAEDIELPPAEAIPPPPTDDTHDPLTFLTLPPEIRHQIYRNCENLVMDKPLVYCLSTFDNEMQHALASVSRLVRSEALAIFYSYNLWVIKVEFRMMYEAFQDWVIRLGEGAGALRLVSFSVRGSLFKPTRSYAQSPGVHAHVVQTALGVTTGPAGASVESHCLQDGDASFRIDLSEKFTGGRVEIVRNDGSKEAGEMAKIQLSKMVAGLWEKRRIGKLNGQDWITMVDEFIAFIGGWETEKPTRTFRLSMI